MDAITGRAPFVAKPIGFLERVANSPILRALGGLQAVAAVTLPFRVWNLGKALRDCRHGDSQGARREAHFRVAAETGGMVTAATRTATGYSAIAWLVRGTMPIWATVVFAVGGILGLAWIAVDSIGLLRTKRFMKRLEENATPDEIFERLREACKEHRSDVAAHFMISDEKALGDTVERADTPKKKEDLWTELKARAEAKMASHKVMLVAEAVSVFATALLLIPPLTGVGLALYTVVGVAMTVQSARDLWAWYRPPADIIRTQESELKTPQEVQQQRAVEDRRTVALLKAFEPGSIEMKNIQQSLTGGKV